MGVCHIDDEFETAFFVGPEGGIFQGMNLEVSVPAGAVDGEASLTIKDLKFGNCIKEVEAVYDGRIDSLEIIRYLVRNDIDKSRKLFYLNLWLS